MVSTLLADLLSKLGFKSSTNDKALLYLIDNTGIMYILVYVDDFLILGDSEVLWNKKQRRRHNETSAGKRNISFFTQ